MIPASLSDDEDARNLKRHVDLGRIQNFRKDLTLDLLFEELFKMVPLLKVQKFKENGSEIAHILECRKSMPGKLLLSVGCDIKRRIGCENFRIVPIVYSNVVTNDTALLVNPESRNDQGITGAENDRGTQDESQNKKGDSTPKGSVDPGGSGPGNETRKEEATP